MLHDNEVVLFQRVCVACNGVYGCNNGLVSKDCERCRQIECSFDSRIVLPEEQSHGFCLDCMAEMTGKKRFGSRDCW